MTLLDYAQYLSSEHERLSRLVMDEVCNRTENYKADHKDHLVLLSQKLRSVQELIENSFVSGAK